MAEKGGLAVLIGAGKPAPAEEGEDDEKSLAAKSLIKAIKASDAAGVADAFQLLYDACGSHSMSEESDDEV